MKIAVCIKQVVDARMPLQVMRGQDKVQQPGGAGEPVRLINPADRTALEVGLQFRAAVHGGEVHAFSVCAEDRQDALYFARARGADAVERLAPPREHRGPPATALALAERLRQQSYNLVLCGDRTLDNSAAMVGPLLAELLGLPQATSVGHLREYDHRGAIVERKLERGYRQLVRATLPALIAVTEDAMRPQYVSRRRLERARRAEIPVHDPAGSSESLDLPPWPDSEKFKQPRARTKQVSAPGGNKAASERLQMMMGDVGGQGGGQDGGNGQSSEGASILDGDPEYLSEQLFRFLRHHEFI